MSDKLIATAAEAVADIGSGARIAVGGFGLCGVPDTLLEALSASQAAGLEIYSNNCGVDDYGLGHLLNNRQIRRVTASYVGENKEFARQYLSGELEVELIPQGTLAERLRAGGAGIPAFYTPAGVGTPVADGGMPWKYNATGDVVVASPSKQVRIFDDKPFVLERAIVTDYALVHATTGDTEGNLIFDKAARNFNPLVAMAGRITIAQVENLVEAGELDPAAVHVPGVFVQRIVHTGAQQKRIEKRTVRKVAE